MTSTQSSTLDDAYFDRNLLALAFARLALAAGWPAGMKENPDDPAWPVLYVDTPHGQVSWHLPADEVDLAVWPVYAGTWDGHDLHEKRRRILAIGVALSPGS